MLLLSSLFSSSSSPHSRLLLLRLHIHLRRSISSSRHRHPHHYSTFLSLILSTPSGPPTLALGKTLVSTGLAAATLLLSIPILRLCQVHLHQARPTGFPSDSDSAFVFRKFSQLVLRRRPPLRYPPPITFSKLQLPPRRRC
ncbi:hypothetical protein CK203_087422 [Vitis vinifera]|uniref:Uncharacterized protein n=1 Tax=Vitis vinifera TaxID=29760 RepID=A0A438D307_VITVI|nr:hypothetical protein CK203_087422 [Vitis vinifera]